jgi:hypothetical protein
MIVIEVSGLSFCFWVPENADSVHFAAGKKVRLVWLVF